jgi:3-methyladenine DNA glycosylase AlkD
MQAREVLKQLEALGSEQTRKIWHRHGVVGPMFGVKYGDLEKLRKQVGRDQALARALWQSGNHDARILAVMVAEPATFDAAALRAWQKDATYYILADALAAHVASRSPAWREVIAEWLDAGVESARRAGWTLVSHLAKDDPDLEDSFFAPLIARIEKEIRSAPNRVREALNWTLIGIGARSDALAAPAIAAAERIGPVDIDHGDTCCKTPDAALYIAKARAHQSKKTAAKKTSARKTAKKAPADKPAKKTAKKPAARASARA